MTTPPLPGGVPSFYTVSPLWSRKTNSLGDFRRTGAPEARKRSERSKNVAINQKITWLTHPIQINSTKRNALMLRLALLYQNLKFYCSWGKLNVKVNICLQNSFTQLRRKLQVDLRDKQKLIKMVSILSKKPILLIKVVKNGLFIVYTSGV